MPRTPFGIWTKLWPLGLASSRLPLQTVGCRAIRKTIEMVVVAGGIRTLSVMRGTVLADVIRDLHHDHHRLPGGQGLLHPRGDRDSRHHCDGHGNRRHLGGGRVQLAEALDSSDHRAGFGSI